MNLPRFVCILLPLAVVSCQPTASPSAATAPSKDKSDSKKGTITVTINGREATPEDAEAFGALGKKLLSDALHKAINEGVQTFLKKLDISDPIETDLFSVSFGPETSRGDQLWSVVLDFARFDEERFWRDYQWLLDQHPGAGLERYRAEFERRASPVEAPEAEPGAAP